MSTLHVVPPPSKDPEPTPVVAKFGKLVAYIPQPKTFEEVNGLLVKGVKKQVEVSEFARSLVKGGEGSGNFGHSGREGEVGGSGVRGHTTEEISRVKWVQHPKIGVKSGDANEIEHYQLLENTGVMYDHVNRGGVYLGQKGVGHAYTNNPTLPGMTAEETARMSGRSVLDEEAVEHHLKQQYGVKRVVWHENLHQALDAAKVGKSVTTSFANSLLSNLKKADFASGGIVENSKPYIVGEHVCCGVLVKFQPRPLTKQTQIILHKDFQHPKLDTAQAGMQKVLVNLFNKQKELAVGVVKGLGKRFFEAPQGRFGTITDKEKEVIVAKKPFSTTISKLAKADDDTSFRDALIARIQSLIDSVWELLPSAVQDNILQAVQVGTDKGVGELNISDSELINDVNQAAADWARDRSAEMVGMKYDDSGNLIENPDAEYAISDTTRDGIRDLVSSSFESPTGVDTLAQQLQDSFLFSPDRAMNIARTEIKSAAVEANWDLWEASGLVEEVSFLNSEDPGVCSLCEDLADGSPYAFEDAPHPVQDTHPQCRCSIVASKLRDQSSIGKFAKFLVS